MVMLFIWPTLKAAGQLRPADGISIMDALPIQAPTVEPTARVGVLALYNVTTAPMASAMAKNSMRPDFKVWKKLVLLILIILLDTWPAALRPLVFRGREERLAVARTLATKKLSEDEARRNLSLLRRCSSNIGIKKMIILDRHCYAMLAVRLNFVAQHLTTQEGGGAGVLALLKSNDHVYL